MLRGNQSGFTIIELLVVVLILALLMGIITPILGDDAQASRDARRAWDLRSIQSALREYHRLNGAYPDTSGAWQGDAPAFGGLGYGSAGYISGLVPDYLPALPRDPQPDYPAGDAGYMYRSDGTDYKVVIHKTPESFPPANTFFDPQRPDTSWMVSTPAAYNW